MIKLVLNITIINNTSWTFMNSDEDDRISSLKLTDALGVA